MAAWVAAAAFAMPGCSKTAEGPTPQESAGASEGPQVQPGRAGAPAAPPRSAAAPGSSAAGEPADAGAPVAPPTEAAAAADPTATPPATPPERVTDTAARKAAATWLRAVDSSGLDGEAVGPLMVFPAQLTAHTGRPDCHGEWIIADLAGLKERLPCLVDRGLGGLAAATRTAQVVRFEPGHELADAAFALGPGWAASAGAVVVEVKRRGGPTALLEVIPSPGAIGEAPPRIRNAALVWPRPPD